MSITITLMNDDDSEEEHDLPSKKEVCHDCLGEGFVLNESMRHHAYTPEEFNEEFDEEMREQYFKRGGIYDVRCPTCKGQNVIDVVDEEACQRNDQLKDICERWQKQEEERARYEAMDRATERMERMMGC